MSLIFESYTKQRESWPQSGRHIMAQYDDESIIVYQAYGPVIGEFASQHKYFKAGFSLERMSWIKTNFLWMMYRSGWAQKEGQKIVLAVKLKRSFFDRALSLAVASTFNENIYASEEEWRDAMKTSAVRLQWDPDHDPKGEKEERRAIQLGLKGDILREYSKEAIVDIYDMTQFVNDQFNNLQSGVVDDLIVPLEKEYLVDDEAVKKSVGV